MQGLTEAACLASCLDLDFIAAAFVRTLANFTALHEPQRMRMPHAHALRHLLLLPDRVGAPPAFLPARRDVRLTFSAGCAGEAEMCVLAA